jgi:hypothetical protein
MGVSRGFLPSTSRMRISLQDISLAQVFTWCNIIDKLVSALCEVTVDLRKLPPTAWKKCGNGQYYQAIYEIGFRFGSELVFQFMSKGLVLENVLARYN